MALLLPKNHISGAFQPSVSQYVKFSEGEYTRVSFNELRWSIYVNEIFLDQMASNLYDRILFSGYNNKMLKSYGPDWRIKLTQAVYCDYLCAYVFAKKVLVDGNAQWDQSRSYFSTVKLTHGSREFLNILSSSQAGFQVTGTSLRFYHSFILEENDDTEYILTLNFSDEEKRRTRNNGFRDPEFLGMLEFIKNECKISDLDLGSVSVTSQGSDPKCIGDVINFSDSNPGDSTKGTYYVLRSDGLTSTSIAYNLIYNTRLTQHVFQNMDVIDLCYFKRLGYPLSEVRELQTSIWLGFAFHTPGFKSSSDTVNNNDNKPGPKRPSDSGKKDDKPSSQEKNVTSKDVTKRSNPENPAPNSNPDSSGSNLDNTSVNKYSDTSVQTELILPIQQVDKVIQTISSNNDFKDKVEELVIQKDPHTIRDLISKGLALTIAASTALVANKLALGRTVNKTVKQGSIKTTGKINLGPLSIKHSSKNYNYKPT